MLLPGIFARDLFEEVLDSQFYGYPHNSALMKTDVKETEKGYELSMDLPGVKKEDLKVELKDGYLNISATCNQSKDEKDARGRYIRRERYSGTISRSFYVGKNITQEEVQARFKDGTLILQIPKKEQAVQIEEKKYIPIEG